MNEVPVALPVQECVDECIVSFQLVGRAHVPSVFCPNQVHIIDRRKCEVTARFVCSLVGYLLFHVRECLQIFLVRSGAMNARYCVAPMSSSAWGIDQTARISDVVRVASRSAEVGTSS